MEGDDSNGRAREIGFWVMGRKGEEIEFDVLGK